MEYKVLRVPFGRQICFPCEDGTFICLSTSYDDMTRRRDYSVAHCREWFLGEWETLGWQEFETWQEAKKRALEWAEDLILRFLFACPRRH